MVRLVAVGDIHADLEALIAILRGMEIIADDGAWAAGAAQLVLIGDLNDRGNDSVEVMHYVMDLEVQARTSGGAVHALLGNHEIMAAKQQYRYVKPTEYLKHEHFWFDGVNGLDAIYGGKSPFAAWIRCRPTLVRIGTTLFAHAGVDSRVAELGIDGVNRAVADWVSFFQRVADEPDVATEWLVEEDGQGPLWDKRFSVGSADPSTTEAELTNTLRELDAARLVVGHAPTRQLDYRLAWPHPRFGEHVALIDTGISMHFGGRLSAVEIAADLTVRYFERPQSSAIADARRAVTNDYLAEIADRG